LKEIAMNTITTIEKYIDDAVIIADNYKSILAEEPDNFAYELSLITINEHIADLQRQLKREKTANSLLKMKNMYCPPS